MYNGSSGPFPRTAPAPEHQHFSKIVDLDNHKRSIKTDIANRLYTLKNLYKTRSRKPKPKPKQLSLSVSSNPGKKLGACGACKFRMVRSKRYTEKIMLRK
jgi:hypothetical protein